MILYRPVGLQELSLIYDSGMKAFPRLPQQPIFYPVLQLDYARQTASEWNAENGQLAGYVTQFKVEDEYITPFEEHTVGGSQHQELWIPAEEIEEFNRHIIGHIKVVEAHFGDAFQGFIPEAFGLQGKNAIEQFTLLANSYLYKRMDFYLEIKRNHKAVFLNYAFWQKYEFKNPGLKEKILQAIKEAWLTSFPNIPLVNPVQEDTALVNQADSDSMLDAVDEEITPVKQSYSDSLITPVHKEIAPVAQTDSPSLVNHGHEDTALPRQTDSHFAQGIKLGLSGKVHEAVAELSKAVEEDPNHVIAHVSLGVAFHRLGEDDRALDYYETALRLDPIYAEAHYFRANILYSRGNVREAIAGYTMTIGLKPELIEAHQKPSPQDRLTDYTGSPAEIYWIVKPAQRILNLNELLKSNPGQVDLFKERAAEYYRLWNYAQTIADYSSFLTVQPNDANVLHLRGVAYEQLGQFDRALKDYQQAIALDPGLANAHLNRGVTLGNTGNYRRALASFTEGIRLAPKNPDGYFNRGTAYFQLGDFEPAIADFSMVIQLSSTDEDAYYWRGISNEAAGRRQEAMTDYRQFLAISQNSQARAEIEQKLRQWNEEERHVVSDRNILTEDKRTITQASSGTSDQHFDVYDLIVTLGERALHSTWFGSAVSCSGETAEELYALTEQNTPIQGHDILRLTSGIRQTIEGDFQAFDPDATSPWIFIRAWNGDGFYIETDDSQVEGQLKAHFQTLEKVEGASPPYRGLFIPI